MKTEQIERVLRVLGAKKAGTISLRDFLLIVGNRIRVSNN